MTPLLHAEGVGVDGRLQPIDLRCAAAEMVAVIGPNGAGKTTLLRALAGIEQASGTVVIDGDELAASPPARRMRLLSYLPATRALLWPISAQDVISLGLPSPDPRRIDKLIELLELRPLCTRPANSLSTGERSRVLLARALAPRPRLLLLDEPLSNLDPYWVLRSLELLREAARTENCTVIATLHDLTQLVAFDRVLLIESGHLVADEEPMRIVEDPALASAFRIRRDADGWRISDPLSSGAGPRSSQ